MRSTSTTPINHYKCPQFSTRRAASKRESCLCFNLLITGEYVVAQSIWLTRVRLCNTVIIIHSFSFQESDRLKIRRGGKMHNYWCVVLAVFCGCFIAAKADGMSCAFERKSLKNIEALLPLLLSAHWSIFFSFV